MKLGRLRWIMLVCVTTQLMAGGKGGKGCDPSVQSGGDTASVQKLLSETEVAIEQLLPKVKKEEVLDFKLDLAHLSRGGSQYSTDIEAIDKFAKENPSYKGIDFQKLLEQKKLHVWASKHAYVLDIDPQYFSDQVLNDPTFQEETLIDTKVSVDPENPNKLTYVRKGVKLGLIQLADVESTSEGHSHDTTTEKGDLTPDQIEVIEKLDGEIKEKPEKMTVSYTLKTSDKRARGATSITEYYRIDRNKTLLVNRCFAVFDKPFMVPLGPARGVNSKVAPKESKKIVEKMREYIKCHPIK